jgi:signal transduction histidine kinase
VIVVVGSLIQWLNLSRLQRRITMSEITAEFVDAILEVRRYEKNWLLYKDPQALVENHHQIDKVLRIIERYKEEFPDLFEASSLLKEISKRVQVYQSLMDQLLHAENPVNAKQLMRKIRHEGQALIEDLHQFRKEEHRTLKRSLDSIILITILFSIIAAFISIIMGIYLANSIVRPLKKVVHCMEDIAKGRFVICENPIEIAEIHAIHDALMTMLKELAKREKEVVQSKKLAALGTLVAGAAHEINNPISNIVSSAEILKEEMDEEEFDEEFAREMVDQIIDQSDRAKKIIWSLLEFSREKELQYQEVDLEELLKESVGLLSVPVPEGVEIKVETGRGGTVVLDRQRMQQVFLNLLKNAVQAVGERGHILLWGSIDPEDRKVVFKIQDDGSGISKQAMDRIFDPFFTTKEVGHGSGLGLSVAHEIVSKHGGKIEVQSSEGRGTTFTIVLPMRDISEIKEVE